ncbi:hypothetical protein [Shewanella goraebulensis]|uniref:hypothetical protein n=1 Tax=Shewanella goraebulensis TaxID=3050637 RepID=UPI00254D4A3C|nr:hypothetical protein [Shewanella goraebulensis]
MDKVAIREAIDNLELLNIKIQNSQLEVSDSIEGVTPNNMSQQSMLHIEGQILESVIEVSDSHKSVDMLQVKITFGVRYILENRSNSPQEEEKDAGSTIDKEEMAKIEATYLLEYAIKNDIKSEAIQEFCEFNAVHNCWSFWREHVFSTCQKAQIPIFSIPFFKSNK